MKEVKELFKSLDGRKIEIQSDGLTIGVTLFTKDTVVKYQENFGLNFYHTLEWNNHDNLIEDFSDSIEVIVKDQESNKKDYQLYGEIMEAFKNFKNTALIYCCTLSENNVKSFKCNYYEKELSTVDLEYENMKLTLRIVK